MRESKNPALDAKIAKRIAMGNSTAKIVADIPGATRYRVQQVRYKKNLSRKVSDNFQEVEQTVGYYRNGSGALGLHPEHYETSRQQKFIKGFAYAFGAAILFILGLSLF